MFWLFIEHMTFLDWKEHYRSPNNVTIRLTIDAAYWTIASNENARKYDNYFWLLNS